jgi:integrase/recombinase XerC
MAAAIAGHHDTELGGKPVNDLVPIPRRPAPIASSHAADVLQTWIAGRNPNTLKAYMRDLADFARFLFPDATTPAAGAAVEALLGFGHGGANQVVMRYAADLKERGLKSATIARRLSALKSMVKIGRRIGRITWALDVESPKVEAYRDTSGPGHDGYLAMRGSLERILQGGAQGKALAVAKRDYAIFRLTYTLGLRRGSVASVDLADLDLDIDPAVIYLVEKRKTEKQKYSLPWQVRDAVNEWIAIRGKRPGALFTRLDPGANGELARMDGGSVNRIVKRIAKLAGLKRRVSAHGLRHQAVTRILELNNGNIREAQMFAGHAKPETTIRYDDNRKDVAGMVAQRLADD